jgi:hypothetical protein
MSLSLIKCRDIVVCQKTKKWNCGSIHRITWRALWAFKFFIRYYGEFLFQTYSIDVPVLSYGQIFRVSDCFFSFLRGRNLIPASNLVHYCMSDSLQCQFQLSINFLFHSTTPSLRDWFIQSLSHSSMQTFNHSVIESSNFQSSNDPIIQSVNLSIIQSVNHACIPQS